MAAFPVVTTTLCVNIFELQHRQETLLLLIVEAAGARKFFGIFVSPEQHVTDDQNAGNIEFRTRVELESRDEGEGIHELHRNEIRNCPMRPDGLGDVTEGD